GNDLQRCGPHPLCGGQRSGLESFAEITRKTQYRPRCGSEGPHPERILVLELKKSGDLLQNLGHGLLVHEALKHAHHAAPACAQASRAGARVRQPSPNSSSPPTIECSRSAPKAEAKRAVPSGRASAPGLGPVASTAEKPRRSGRSPKIPSTRSVPVGVEWTKHPSSGSAVWLSTTAAHTRC